MTFKEFKERFRKNVVSVGYVVFTIMLAASVFLVGGVLFLVFSFSDSATEQATRICLLVFSTVCFVCFFLFAVISPILVAVYPKYKKITHAFFQKSIFAAEGAAASEGHFIEPPPIDEGCATRVLTVERKKSFVGCVGKLKICIEDAYGEIELKGVRYRQLGTLKNGEAKSFDIPTRACRICAFYDIVFAQRYGFACKQLPEGEEDISLTGKSRLSPMKGNLFLFE